MKNTPGTGERFSSRTDRQWRPILTSRLGPVGTHFNERGPKWKKLLYKKQPYPDNYTDEWFLSQLKRNTAIAKYPYWKLVDDFTLIVFHLSNILLVILAFTGIYRNHWSAVWPATISSCITVLGYFIWRRLNNQVIVKQYGDFKGPTNGRVPISQSGSQIKSFLLVIFSIAVFSPVLMSLTGSTSSDSIWALSFILCIFNAICHDYAVDVTVTQYRPILSTNISLTNALVLASRLRSTSQVFYFILFAVEVNILLPLFDFSIRKNKSWFAYHKVLVACLLCVVYYMMIELVGWTILVLWLSAQAGIAFAIPSYFLFLQKYKNEIQGPWDTANPVLSK